jgi:hypothetical protein
MEDFDVLSPGQYTYDFDYTYTFDYKIPSNFSLYVAYSPALSALSEALIRNRANSCSSFADGDNGNDSPYSDSYTESSNRSHMTRRGSSSSCDSSSSSASSASSASSSCPCNPSIDNIASIGTHMYDNPGTVSSATTVYVSRERLAALEFLEKNISTIISEQVRNYYDGYTVSSISE